MPDFRARFRTPLFLLFLGGVIASLGLVATWTAAQGTKKIPGDSPLAALDAPSGFAVHVNFSDANALLKLADNGRYLVHGLTADPLQVASAREAIRESHLEGTVSVEQGELSQLPYTDNLVNLLVVDQFPQAGGLSLAEALRVVAPQGTLRVGVGSDREAARRITAEAGKIGVEGIRWEETGGGQWATLVKPRTEGMDVWSQQRYDASGSAASKERELDVPNGVRWVAGPNWATHLRYSAVQGVTASEKRLVYFFDEEVPEERLSEVRTQLDKTPTGKMRQHSLVARDAFNGLFLWKRWIEGTPRGSLLITREDRIYTQLDEREPLVGLDPTSGETVRTYEKIDRPSQVIYEDDRLIAITRSEGVVAVDPESGRVLWQHDVSASGLVAGNGQVFYLTNQRDGDGKEETLIECVDLASGERKWQAGTGKMKEGRGLKLIFHQDDVLVFGGSKGTHAASAKDGRHLWSYSYPKIGHGGSYSKVLSFDGLVWVHPAESDGKKQYAWEGLDPRTGKVSKRFMQPKDFKLTHRCYEDRASGRQILCGTMDFVDVESGGYTHFAAARHSCRDGGVLPGNGMLYTFPHSCHCYPMLRGFLGLATKRERSPEQPSLERGPAFGQVTAPAGTAGGAWPTLRGNPQRSASTNANGPAELEPLWDRSIAGTGKGQPAIEWPHKEAGRLSSPVVADGTVYVAAVDAHRLEAIDASSGRPRWTFIADGRIDAPPTIHDGLCLFGARDGRVYCLRASDGALVWRLRAAPHEERIVAYGQLESTWPIAGGVLVHDDVAYFCAGRHSHGDGGIHVFAAEPATGKVLWQAQPEGFMGLADMLIGRADKVHMITWEFDVQTGENRASQAENEYLRAGRLGLRSDAWYDRPIALRKSRQQWSVAGEAGQNLVFNEERLFGFRAGEEQTREFLRGIEPLQGEASLFGKKLSARRGSQTWNTTFPQGSQLRSLAVAGDRLYVAGRLGGNDPQTYAVQIVSAEDGTVVDSIPLESEPVHDGLAITGGRVFLSTQDGRILCLGSK